MTLIDWSMNAHITNLFELCYLSEDGAPAPEPPTNIVVVQSSPNGVSMAWDACIAGSDNSPIHRCVAGDGFQLLSKSKSKCTLN